MRTVEEIIRDQDNTNTLTLWDKEPNILFMHVGQTLHQSKESTPQALVHIKPTPHPDLVLLQLCNYLNRMGTENRAKSYKVTSLVPGPGSYSNQNSLIGPKWRLCIH